ncbi:MAG: T9SS type A sorting domain-containing protein, partial [Saprospiraceae bacterium]|nr:T9SS type A sorting domain-containing protein [Saprospiraceae bacterium]
LPVNCKKVNIYLFKNNEFDKLILLKENTDNDGFEIVDIPDLGTNIRARIMVKAVDHIFFDVSDKTFRIIDARSSGVNFGVTPNVINLCLPQLAEIKLKSCSYGNYKGNLNLFIESGLPQGSTYRFEKSGISESEETKLVIDVNNLTSKSTLNLVIGAITPEGDTLRDNLVINAINNDFSDQALLTPQNGSVSVIETPVFRWKKSFNSTVYNFEIATSPVFGNTIVYSQSNITVDTLLLPVLLKESKIYYWRVIPINDCGLGSSTLTYALQTVNKTCVDQAYTGNSIGLFSNKTHSVKIPVNFNGIISDINLNNVEVDADAINATKLFLVSPSGKRVNLFNMQCGVLLDFRCHFDDEAPIPIKCPPIAWARMRPFEPLARFKGESLQGNWAFEVVTTTAFRDGLIRNFTLQYCADLKVTNPFSAINEPLRLNIGESKGIPNSLLLSQDTDNSPSELVYTVVHAPASGNLLLEGNPLNIGSTFSQKDIDDNKLSYQNTGNSSLIDGFYYTVNDGANGWYGVSFFTIYVGAVATKDVNEKQSFEIYPNPGSGLFHIILNDSHFSDAKVFITSISGKSLIQTDLKSLHLLQLDFSMLNDGVYLVTLVNKNSSITKKLILRRN